MDYFPIMRELGRLLERMLSIQSGFQRKTCEVRVDKIMQEMEAVHNYFISNLDFVVALIEDTDFLASKRSNDPSVQIMQILETIRSLEKSRYESRIKRHELFEKVKMGALESISERSLAIVALSETQDKCLRAFYSSIENYFVLGGRYSHKLAEFLQEIRLQILDMRRNSTVVQLSTTRSLVLDEIERMQANWRLIAESYSRVKNEFPSQ
ncbi:hypothetical protein [Rhodopseudomonas parapalustris]